MPDTGNTLPELPPARFVTRPGGYVTSYFVLGPVDGVPLVLCHGIAANGLQAVDDALYFARRGFRVIVPDLRGHGRSTCPAQRSDEDFSIDALAGDLLAVLDAEDISRTHWVGNSLGGIVALGIMGIQPERLLSFASFGTAYALNLPSVLVMLGGEGYRLLGTRIVASIGAPMTCREPAAQAIIREMLRGVDIDAVMRTAKSVAQYDLIENALSYDGPILMIRSNLDIAVNTALKPTLQAMEGRANFRLVDLDGAGHVANLDQPEAIRAFILDFIGSTSGLPKAV